MCWEIVHKLNFFHLDNFVIFPLNKVNCKFSLGNFVQHFLLFCWKHPHDRDLVICGHQYKSESVGGEVLLRNKLVRLSFPCLQALLVATTNLWRVVLLLNNLLSQ